MVSPRASSAHGGIGRKLSPEPEIPGWPGVCSGSLTHEARDLRPEGAPATGGDPRWEGGRSARRGRAPGLPLHPRGVRAEQPGDGAGCRPRRPRPSRREGPRRQTGARPAASVPALPADPLRSRKRRREGIDLERRIAGPEEEIPWPAGAGVARLRAEGGRGAGPGGRGRRRRRRPRPRVRLHARQRLGREGRVGRPPRRPPRASRSRSAPAWSRPTSSTHRRCSCRRRSRARRWRRGT